MNYWNRIKQIYSSEFFKYSVALLSSNAISQLIGILAYPVITRIYSPDVFGEFTFFFTIAGILSIMVTARYESAIVLPKSEKKAVALFQLSVIFNLFFFVLLFFIISLWNEEIASILNQKGLAPLLPLLPVVVLTSGIWQSFTYFFIRRKRYYSISAYNILQSSMGAILKCLLGVRGFMQAGLVWGQFGGQFSGVVAGLAGNKHILKDIAKVNKPEILEAAKQYSNFPKFMLFKDLLNMLSGNLPVLLLSFYFGMKEIGLFSMALTLGFRPVNLFSSSIHQILFRKMSERVQNREKLADICFSFCKMCSILILPFFFVFLLVPDNFFIMLFGAKWGGLGFYLKLMLPWLFLIILAASLSSVPDLFFNQKTALNIEIVYVILRTVSLLSGVYFQSFKMAIILYCIISALVSGVKLIWYFQLIKKYESNSQINKK
jgi:O-antigen/teichoic acid export membrane protein